MRTAQSLRSVEGGDDSSIGKAVFGALPAIKRPPRQPGGKPRIRRRDLERLIEMAKQEAAKKRTQAPSTAEQTGGYAAREPHGTKTSPRRGAQRNGERGSPSADEPHLGKRRSKPKRGANFSRAENKEILERAHSGERLKQIAADLNRPEASVRSVVKRDRDRRREQHEANTRARKRVRREVVEISRKERCQRCGGAFLRDEDGDPTCISCGRRFNPRVSEVNGFDQTAWLMAHNRGVGVWLAEGDDQKIATKRHERQTVERKGTR